MKDTCFCSLFPNYKKDIARDKSSNLKILGVFIATTPPCLVTIRIDKEQGGTQNGRPQSMV
jgi:hypothetical protein